MKVMQPITLTLPKKAAEAVGHYVDCDDPVTGVRTVCAVKSAKITAYRGYFVRLTAQLVEVGQPAAAKRLSAKIPAVCA